MNICKVSHVTITVLSFAFNMSVMALYNEPILISPISDDVTQYKDNFKVHYHYDKGDSDLPSREK